MGAFFGEDDDGVNAGEGCEDGGALPLRDKWTSRPFQLADGTVTVEADDEEIAELSGALQVTHVAEVKQIETTVGGDHALAPAARGSSPWGGLLQRQNFVGSGFSHWFLGLIPCRALT